MALPQPGKPDVTDKIRDIISNTSENLLYLDTNIREVKVVSFDFDWLALGLGAKGVTVATVGFEPSMIILLSGFPEGHTASIGIYSSSGAYKNNCFWFDYYGVETGFGDRRMSFLPGFSFVHAPYGATFFGVPTYNYGGVTSTNAAGFVISLFNYFTTGTATTHALCIK